MAEVDWLIQRATAQSDQIHRALAESQASACHLVYDPVLAPFGADDETARWLGENEPARKIISNSAKLDPSAMPLRVPLTISQGHGSEVLSNSLLLSLRELQVQSLQLGRGRRVCGWVQAEDPDAAFKHFGHNMLQRRPDGAPVWLRLHDPAVLWALWPLLTTEQQANLLGPLTAWWLHDPAGHIQSLTAPHMSHEPFVLRAEQFVLVDGIHAVNSALRDRLAAEVEPGGVSSKQVRQWWSGAFAALQRALRCGITDANDLVAFCAHALLKHPQFDEHPRIAERLSRRAVDQYFTELIDDVTEQDWHVIATELSIPAERVERHSPA